MIAEKGTEIQYIVKEVAVPAEYEQKVTGSANTGFEIQNTWSKEEETTPQPTTQQPTTPHSGNRDVVRIGDINNTILWVILGLVALVGISTAVMILIRGKNKQN